MRNMRGVALALVVMMALLTGIASCKPSLPSDILSQDDMGDILYDYHIALAMAESDPSTRSGGNIAYKLAVLKKHDVSEAEFDSSMVYYARHTEMLKQVYERISDKLSKEAVALGADANDLANFGDIASAGDTANVWNGARTMCLMTNKPLNSYSFSIPADTAFRKGDRLVLDFDAQFIFQDGMRDGVVVLAMQLKNDSVVSQLVHVQNSQHYTVQLEDNGRIGIKNVRGYFLLGNGDYAMENASMTTLKLMFLQHIRLVRVHQKEMPAASEPMDAQGDSLGHTQLEEMHMMPGHRPKPMPIENMEKGMDPSKGGGPARTALPARMNGPVKNKR